VTCACVTDDPGQRVCMQTVYVRTMTLDTANTGGSLHGCKSDRSFKLHLYNFWVCEEFYFHVSVCLYGIMDSRNDNFTSTALYIENYKSLPA
jgi:hypothetical protein